MGSSAMEQVGEDLVDLGHVPMPQWCESFDELWTENLIKESCLEVIERRFPDISLNFEEVRSPTSAFNLTYLREVTGSSSAWHKDSNARRMLLFCWSNKCPTNFAFMPTGHDPWKMYPQDSWHDEEIDPQTVVVPKVEHLVCVRNDLWVHKIDTTTEDITGRWFFRVHADIVPAVFYNLDRRDYNLRG